MVAYTFVMRDLTEKQVRLLRYINDYRLRNHGAAPTLREVVRGAGVSDNKSAIRVMKILEGREYLRRSGKRKSRSIRLTNKALELLNDSSFPVEYHYASPVGEETPSSSPDFVGYAASQGSLKTDGTTLDDELKVVIETAVSLAIRRYFSFGAVGEGFWRSLINVVVDFVVRVFRRAGFLESLSWAILTVILFWAYLRIVEDQLVGFGFALATVLVVKKFLMD